MTPLLDALIMLLGSWAPVFAQQRSSVRAMAHVLALMLALGRRTITRAVAAQGRAYSNGWNTDYKLFSRSRWEPRDLFRPVWAEYLTRYPNDWIAVAVDETGIEKSGKHIPDVQYMRDPMSPKFQTNLILGLRFLQASLLFPHYREQDCPPRGIPVSFTQATRVKKPGKRASSEQMAEYRRAQKLHNMSTQSVDLFRELRRQADQHGAAERTLLLSLDGGFANQTVFKAALERTELIARCRKDAVLCRPAHEGSKRVYDPHQFTPQEVLHDESIPFKEAVVYLGGQWRTIRYKAVSPLLWQRGAGRRRLRLIVVEPIPYRKSPNYRIRRRDPSFLLSTDLTSPTELLLQVYCDRWQIEVNHREEKDIVGVGQAQVRSPLSVPRHPALAVAGYSLLLLAGLQAFGPGRSDAYQTLPRWRRNRKRPSILDLLTLLRAELLHTSLHPSACPRQNGHEMGSSSTGALLSTLRSGSVTPEHLLRQAFT